MTELSNVLHRFCRWLFLLQGKTRLCVSAFCGMATAAALPPFYIVPLCLLSFSALVIMTDGIISGRDNAPSAVLTAQKLKASAALGWFFGLGYFTAGLWWLADAMTVDIGQFGWAIPLTVFGFPAFLACYYALAIFLAVLFWRKGIARIAVLSLAFAFAEYLRSILWTGFPWNALGYTAMPCPIFMQLDALIGLNGMNILAVFFYSLPSLLWKDSPFYQRRQGRYALCLALLLLAGDAGFGAWRLTAADTYSPEQTLAAPDLPTSEITPAATALSAPVPVLRIRLVQPAVAQEQKQDAEARQETLDNLLSLSSALPKDGGKTPDIIIWPETAIPYLLNYNQAALETISSSLQKNQILLAGAVRVEEKQHTVINRIDTDKDTQNRENHAPAENLSPQYRFFNSVMMIDSHGVILDSADKVHLVPFGEYLPLAKIARALNLTPLAKIAGPYSAAEKRKVLQLPNGITVLPLICYEAIFPHELHPEDTKSADVIINITNDAWFGDTPGPKQHLAQARLRAVEQRLPLIRVANSGISAYIDPYGRIKSAIPINKRDFLDIDIAIPKKQP